MMNMSDRRHLNPRSHMATLALQATRGRRKLNEMEARAAVAGLRIATWAPGDGVKRYRFFPGNGETVYADYHEGGALFTARGRKEALAYLSGAGGGPNNRARGTIRRNRRNRATGQGGNAPDRAAATELELFAANTGELYGQRQAIEKNLANKVANGKYDRTKSIALWMHWMEAAAKRYAREFGSATAWHRMFPAPTRRLAAEAFALEFEDNYRNGNYLGDLTKAAHARAAKAGRLPGSPAAQARH